MKLHSLRLTGFKTFGQETEIAFNPGVSAIVGPNGSGKSNVVDAISWVLGEQSPSALRIKRASELIFQPLDGNTARNMASVELSIQEAQQSLPMAGSELSIARTGYRDGESDFYLNGGRTLRKHIRALFAPYGMAQRTFSVIRQGHTDLLLDVNPHNRLRVIQEAAGVLGQIQQKEEALRRLERTLEQLAPVRQELRELRLSMTHLERQARQFERRQALLAELKQVIVPYYLHHFSTVEHELAAKSTAWAEAGREVEALDTARQQNRAAQAELRDHYHRAASQLAELQASIQEAEKATQLNLRQRDVLRERQSQYRARLDALRRNQANLRRRHEETATELKENRTQLRSLTAQLREAEEVASQRRAVLAQRRTQRHQKMQQLQAARQDLTALEQRIAAISQKHAQQTLDAQLVAQTVSAQEDAERDLQRQCAEMGQLQQSQDQAWQELATQQERAQSAAADGSREAQQHAVHVADLQAQRNALDRRQVELTARKSSWEAYLAARMEDFTPVPADQLGEGQVLGILGSLLVVPPRYQKPLAACLGEWMHGLVFQSWDDACTILKPAHAESTQQVVRVAALDRLPAGLPQTARHPALEPLDTVIEYPQALASLIGILLADWYVAETTEVALQYIKACDAGTPLRIVSLTGDLFPGPGLMKLQGTGEMDTHLLKMQHEVQTLNGGIRETNQHLEACTQRWQEATRILEASRESLRQCQEQLVTVNLAVKQSAQERAELATARKQQLARREQLRADHSRNRTHLRELQHAARCHQEMLAELQTERADCRQRVTSLEQALAAPEDEAWSRELEAANLALRNVGRDAGNLQEREVQLQRLQQSLQQDLDTGQEQEEFLNTELESVATDMARLTRQGETRARELDHQHTALAPLVQATQQFVHEQQELDRLHEGLMSELRAEEARVQQLRFALAQLQERKTSLADQLVADGELMAEDHADGTAWSDLRLRLQSLRMSEARMEAEDVISSTDLASLRRRIARSGPAQEDLYLAFQEAGTRAERLEAQLSDLTAAEMQLRDIVQRLDEQLSRKTRHAFHEINQNFSEYFARFFPGGQGWLEMTTAPAGETQGVELFLQLPGKHVQHVASLSGGERAMAALAFICSMLKFNCPPFCVLDEVDAPLDETNVSRIGQTLQELARQTQLILITHNHRMLEYTDAIWGVTLNGAGCSQVLSMRLDHSQEWLATQGQAVGF